MRLEALWESDEPLPRLARAALVPLSYVFRVALRARAALYDRGLVASERAPIAVVSVGNLRVGGSGKTPLSLWIAERAAAAGRNPAIVVRGYGTAAAPVPTVLLSRSRLGEIDERELAACARVIVFAELADLPSALPDEAMLLALRGDAPVVISPDRLAACAVAARLGCDLAVLDDGFQHRRLTRDVDIVLTSAPDARARLLPAGPLREGLAALVRADIVVATDDGAPTGGRTSFHAQTVVRGLVEHAGRDAPVATLESLRGRDVVAVAGIARPERFLSALERAGAKLACVPFLFRDHHPYGADDLAAIAAAAGSAKTVVTTEKDLVKLARIAPRAMRLQALRIDLDVERGDALLDRVLRALPPLDEPRGGPHHRPLAQAGAGTRT